MNPQQSSPVPPGVILVKGAWSSTSDDDIAPPEASRIEKGVFLSQYFGIRYSLLDKWAQGYQGPPPSEDGRYVLADINSGADVGLQHILITAEDLFFTRLPVDSAAALINYTRDHLQADYRVEDPIRTITLASRTFWVLAYDSPVAGLHWYVLSTDIRCHVVNFIFTSRAMMQTAELAKDLRNMKLLSIGSDSIRGTIPHLPLCLKNYASDQHLLKQVKPRLSRQISNTIPVRILIDRDGHVAHVHILSAFSDQSKTIIEALSQWKFKPYLVNGRAVEVETGLVFGMPLAPPVGRFQ